MYIYVCIYKHIYIPYIKYVHINTKFQIKWFESRCVAHP